MKILGSMKRLVNKLLLKNGHIITHYSTVPSFDRLIRLLENSQIWPRTIFDVGVAEGTPWLYDGFQNSNFILVDPTKESLPFMKTLQSIIDAQIYNIALGENDCNIEIIIRADSDIGSASQFSEFGPHVVKDRYTVECRRFDGLFDDFQTPALCKIDVQGAELSVLKGMGKKIHVIDVFIIETSFIATLEGGAPEFGEITEFMSSKGFCIYDIIGITRRPLDQALAQVDAVFVPKDSPLRQDRRWKAEI